jgi:hypothetical protein
VQLFGAIDQFTRPGPHQRPWINRGHERVPELSRKRSSYFKSAICLTHPMMRRAT